MTKTHVVHALTKKYAELCGQLLTADKAMEEVNGLDNYDEALAQLDRKKAALKADLNHIHHVALLFDPNWGPLAVKAKKPKKQAIFGGRGAGLALRVLRKAKAPLTAREIVHGVFAEENLGHPPEDVAAKVDVSVRAAMKRYEKAGYVRCEPGSPMRWSVALRGERSP